MKNSNKILLIDVDSKIPNLALMKLSSFYKSKGYIIEFKKLNYSYYPHNNSCIIIIDGYEKVFVSTIFKTNANRIYFEGESEIIHGGVGFDLKIKLDNDIESTNPDYCLYPENDTSYGFITRGCIRNCEFCVVPKKEGMIHQVNTVEKIVQHKKVKFLDNNILAFKGHLDILKELRDKNIKCQFNQGLDIRLINDTNAKLLSELNYIGEYYFAFDNVKDEKIITDKLNLFKKYITKDWKCKFFIYCNPNMDIQQDVIHRINWCKKHKVLPYLMRDITCWDSLYKNFYIDYCAYCNQPSFFKKLTFEQFMVKRTNNKERQKESIKIFLNQNDKRR